MAGVVKQVKRSNHLGCSVCSLNILDKIIQIVYNNDTARIRAYGTKVPGAGLTRVAVVLLAKGGDVY